MKHLILLILSLSLNAQLLQIDAGASQRTGFYNADQDYINGFTLTSDTYGIGVWKTVRYGIDIVYNIPVENGEYYVMLYFKETNPLQKVGGRVFDINVNGARISNFDLFATRGFANIFKVFHVLVTNNFININLHASKGNAVVFAIDVEYVFPGLIDYCTNNIINANTSGGITDWYCRILQIANNQ